MVLTAMQREFMKAIVEADWVKVEPDTYYAPDAQDVRDGEYGLRVGVTTDEGAHIEMTFRKQDVIKGFAAHLLQEDSP